MTSSRRTSLLAVVFLAASAMDVAGQQLLDRVLARVNGAVITLTDVQAATALGIVNASPATVPPPTPLEQLIERQIMLGEVARFPPPDPTDAAVEAQLAAMRTQAGAKLASILESTGVDEARLRAMARDTLRIEGYIRQRFGAAAQAGSENVRQWIRDARARANVVETPP